MDANPALTATVPAGVGTRRTLVRVLVFALACLLLVSVADELPAAAEALANVHPVALLCLPVFVVWNHVAAMAWQTLLRAAGIGRSSLTELARFRIEAQAINQIVPAAGLAGGALRAIRAAGPHELGASSMATVLDDVAGTVSGLIFAIGAIAFSWQSRARSSEFEAFLLVAVPALFLVLIIALLPFYVAPWLQKRRYLAKVLGAGLATFVRNRIQLRTAFRNAVALRFVERVIAVAEVFIAFRALGFPVSVADAAVVGAVFVIVSFVAFFLPGQIGAAEAAAAATSVFLGFPAALGISVALVRRARQLVVCAVGGVSLLVRRRSAPRPSRSDVGMA